MAAGMTFWLYWKQGCSDIILSSFIHPVLSGLMHPKKSNKKWRKCTTLAPNCCMDTISQTLLGLTTSSFQVTCYLPKGCLKKMDLRTLSQKVGGGPDQIPKFYVCEIGTWGGGGSQTPIFPILNLT